MTALHEFGFSIVKALADYEIVYHKLEGYASLHKRLIGTESFR